MLNDLLEEIGHWQLVIRPAPEETKALHPDARYIIHLTHWPNFGVSPSWFGYGATIDEAIDMAAADFCKAVGRNRLLFEAADEDTKARDEGLADKGVGKDE